MMPPEPFKYICKNCSYSKVVKPKSDVLNFSDIISTCPKCNTEMERKELNFLDKFFSSNIPENQNDWKHS